MTSKISRPEIEELRNSFKEIRFGRIGSLFDQRRAEKVLNVLDRLEKVEEELEKTNPFVIVNTTGHINVSAPEYVSERVTNDD